MTTDATTSGSTRAAGARPHRARPAAAGPKVSEERITLAHGAGGKATQTLVEAVFLEAFRNPLLEPLEDRRGFAVGGTRLALTTDSLRGVAAVLPRRRHRRPRGQRHGQRPRRVRRAGRCTCRPGSSSRRASRSPTCSRIVGVDGRAPPRPPASTIVTGDTKVVQRGKADGCYINTAGVGVLERPVDARRRDRARPATPCWSPGRSATTA